MGEDYRPNSVDAVLSRIETKLNAALKIQDEQVRQISKLKAALARIDVRVTVVASAITGILFLVKLYVFHVQ